MQVAFLAAWLFAAMVSWVDPARHGYYERREETEARYARYAEQMAAVALEEPPLFGGEGGRERTALLLAAVASFESEFHARTAAGLSVRKGDNDDGVAVGLWQTHVYGRTWEGWTRSDLAFDVGKQARVALRMMRDSFHACRALPLPDRLGWYAEGGRGCRANAKSENRVNRAMAWWRGHEISLTGVPVDDAAD